MGLAAKEAFFLNDNILLVDGQDDVVIYNKMFAALGMPLEGEFFGWGVGGASKIEFFSPLYSDLGYRKIAAIFDGDKEGNDQKTTMEKKSPQFKMFCISADDVRDKK